MGRAIRVFINYRRGDTQGDAHAICDRLEERFGEENVFLDTRRLVAGRAWLDDVKSRNHDCEVFLALIGSRWMPSMKAREQAAVADPAADYVRLEIELGLGRNRGVHVIPVLIGDAVPPRAGELPRSLQRLAEIEAARIDYSRFRRDVGDVIARIEAIASTEPEPAEPEPEPATPVVVV